MPASHNEMRRLINKITASRLCAAVRRTSSVCRVSVGSGLIVPLDIAYVTPAKKIDSIYTMAAFDTTTDYSSAQACMYTIEVKDGLWKKLGVKVGDRITIRPAVRAKD